MTWEQIIVFELCLITGMPISLILFNRFSKYGSGKWEL